jgi:ABC-type antimicrobial peptide transport system permease subunit
MISVVDRFWRDLKIGFRALRAAPVVTVVAALSIALGIGASPAIGAVGVLIAIGLVAGLLPALTAARIDPAAMLRES